MTVKTTFANGVNPFLANQPEDKPARVRIKHGSYKRMFPNLKRGAIIPCQADPASTRSLAGALKKYIKDKGLEGIVHRDSVRGIVSWN